MTIRRPLQILACCAALGVSRGGFAQQAGDVSLNYYSLPSRSPAGQGTGLQVTDSTIMHAGVGVEAGYDTNVFYGDKGDAVVGSPVILVVPYIGITNATRSGAAPAGVFFDLDASAGFRRYLSDADQPPVNGVSTGRKISDQPGFLPTVSGLLDFSSGQALSLAFQDAFVRAEDPPYISGTQLTSNASVIHYSNSGTAELRWSPGGGRLQGILRYTNKYDAFNKDSHYDFADSLGHQLSLDLSWKWLPKTAIFVQVSQGYVTYLNSDQMTTGTAPDLVKHDSYPMHALAGLRGLVTQKTTVNLSVGYANAFYVDGPNPEGVAGHLSGNAELTISPTLLNTLGVGYHHDFQNSIVGNFYNIDAVSAWLSQQIAGRVLATAAARYEHRAFQFATSTRTDNFAQVGATIDYHPTKWGYLGVAYALLMNSAGTNTDPAGPAGASYLKQQIYARVGVIY